jgi:hypothetical protein
MARKPTEVVAVTLRIREDLRRRLERAAKKDGISLNAEMERRLEDSFDLTNTASLIRVLVGGGWTAELLGVIAKVFDLGGADRSYPERTEEAQIKIEAAYVALIIIFTELLSTPERRLDPAAAGAVIAAQRGQGILEATLAQTEGALMAKSVLQKVDRNVRRVEYVRVELPPLLVDRGPLKLPKRKKGETK